MTSLLQHRAIADPVSDFRPSDLIEAARWLSAMAEIGPPALPINKMLGGAQLAEFSRGLAFVSQASERLGLDKTHLEAEQALRWVSPAGVAVQWAVDIASALLASLRGEMAGRLCIQLSGDGGALYCDPAPFGEDVARILPVSEEASSAARCLALGLSTAAVFHCIRATEIALRFVARQHLPQASPWSWSAIVRAIDRMARERRAEAGEMWPVEAPFWGDLACHVSAVKLHWRNPIMHADRSFDLEEASAIFQSIRTLLQCIARRWADRGSV